MNCIRYVCPICTIPAALRASMSQITSAQYPLSTFELVMCGMGSNNPAPVEPAAGHTLRDAGSAAPLDFQVPHSPVGAIGVGSTPPAPHCQSPSVASGFWVVSVTNSDGARGRPLLSLPPDPVLIPAAWKAQAGVAGVGSTEPLPSVNACSSP